MLDYLKCCFAIQLFSLSALPDGSCGRRNAQFPLQTIYFFHLEQNVIVFWKPKNRLDSGNPESKPAPPRRSPPPPPLPQKLRLDMAPMAVGCNENSKNSLFSIFFFIRLPFFFQQIKIFIISEKYMTNYIRKV